MTRTADALAPEGRSMHAAAGPSGVNGDGFSLDSILGVRCCFTLIGLKHVVSGVAGRRDNLDQGFHLDLLPSSSLHLRLS